jgi:Tfp pilus assembly protein PilN
VKQQVNLFQSEFKVNEVFLSLDNLLLGVVMLVIILGSLYWYEDRGVRILEGEVSKLESQVAESNKTISKINESLSGEEPAKGTDNSLEGLRKELEDRRRSISRVQDIGQSDSAGFSRYFESLSKNILDGVWLAEFSISSGGTGFEFKGGATDGQLVLGFLEKLSKDKLFENKTFSTLEVSRGDKSASVQFIVNTGEY